MEILPSSDCVRAREAASASLDGELAELEDAFLVVHRAQCASCDAFAAELEGLSAALRAAALEPLPRPIEVPRLRRRADVSFRLAALGAAAVAALAFVAADSLRPTLRSSTSSTDALSLSRNASIDAHFTALNPIVLPQGPRSRVGENIPV
jgi:hypothetical protein